MTEPSSLNIQTSYTESIGRTINFLKAAVNFLSSSTTVYLLALLALLERKFLGRALFDRIDALPPPAF